MDRQQLSFLTIAYLAVFMASAAIIANKLIQISEVENSLKEHYVLALNNWSCTPSFHADALNGKGRGCVRNGYWYPDCSNKTDVLNLYPWG